jgi:hypothetical protein
VLRYGICACRHVERLPLRCVGNRCAIAEIRENRQKPLELQEPNSIPGEESISFVGTRGLGAIGTWGYRWAFPTVL